MNIFTIRIVEIIMRVCTRVCFYVWKVLWTLKVFGKNRCLTIPVKEFILSKVAGLKPAILLKNEFFCRHFSRVLIIMTASGWRNFSCLYMVFVLLYIYGTFNKRWKVAECTFYMAVFSVTTMLAQISQTLWPQSWI